MIIGLDVGGTHIDAVILANKKIVKIVKEPYEQKSLEKYILKTLDILLKNIDLSSIKQINLSTTISTNAIIEDKISKVGMIVQSGPGLPKESLKVSPDTFFISGYTDHRGIIVKDLINNELDEAKNYFKNRQIESLAIATKFSTRNPNTEKTINKKLSKSFKSISLSHKLSGRLNFPRRLNTTYLNAAVNKIYNSFVKTILTSLKNKNIDVPIYVLKADGGIISLNESIDKPVETILSGPAASLMGFLGQFDMAGDGVLLDIGGTTTDIFIIANGEPLFEPLGIEIANHKTLIRSIYSKSIGLGGDSSINIINGQIKIGPKREGKPFCLNGPKPTLTDVFVYKRDLKIGSFDKAKEAVDSLANKLNTTTDDIVNKIINLFTTTLKKEVHKVLSIINNKPVYTIKELLHEEKIEPKFINIMGGPAKLLTPYIEKRFNLKTNYSKNYQVANAIGAALSKITGEINLHVDTNKGHLVVPELSLIRNVKRSMDLKKARELSLKYLSDLMSEKGHHNKDDLEVVFESSFNMVDGFYTKGKNIRITSQVRPGLIYKLGGDKNE